MSDSVDRSSRCEEKTPSRKSEHPRLRRTPGKIHERHVYQRPMVTPRGLTYYDFFAGAGLVRLALEPPWKCVWANDNDPKKADVYASNFGRREFLLEDIAAVSGDVLPPQTNLAWASFPCQDISLAGWRRGMVAPRSGTFWAFWRVMRELQKAGNRPPAAVIENVPGLLHAGNFAALAEALAGLDMQFGAVMVDALWFLPQSRPRVFVVAVDSRLDCGEFVVDGPGNEPWFPKSILAARASLSEEVSTLWRWWKLDRPAKTPARINSIIEDDPADVEWHSQEETRRLLKMMTPRNMDKVQEALSQRSRTVGFLYRRMRDGVQRAEARFDGVAGCLRTPQGGSSRQTVILVEDGQVRTRLLSPREAARLMGVPDSFQLPSRYNDAYRAVGDGVAVPAVRWLSDSLLVPLANARGGRRGKARERQFLPEHRLAALQHKTEALAEQWGRLVS